MTDTVIEARGLTKTYGSRTVVDGIDFKVERGEVVGLLGPNGAGKTTTILMMLGLTEPTAGAVRILDKDPLRQPLEVKRDVGYLPDAVGFYDGMTGRENLAFTARLAGYQPDEAAKRIDSAFERVRLTRNADQKVITYSRGMRQRLGLAELLMRECQVLILDEPTAGLDPQSTDDLLELIDTFAREGMTLLISSHLLDVVQSVCNRVALFNSGRIGFVGTPGELADRVAEDAYRIDVTVADIAPEDVHDVDGVTAIHALGDDRWQVDAVRDIRPEIARRIVERGGTLKRLDAHQIGLGEAYNRFFKEASHEA